ncbi:MAG TPA: type II secretion system protein [Gammaproteobacteria bacterium]|nr:type II secretion system protein [Gammaproteobacteria bacterium]
MFRTLKKPTGFTLIEMIIVIVLLGVISAILTPFISKAMQAYGASKARSDLVSKGRLAMERMAREIRHVVPNSLSVLNSGEGIEFARSKFGGRYVEEFDVFGSEFSQASLRFKKNVTRSGLYILGTGVNNLLSSDVLVIGNSSSAALLAGTTSVLLTGVNDTTLANDGTTKGQILSFANKQFTVESPGKHFVIADNTIEVGLDGTDLRWYTNAGLGNYDGAQDWSSSDPLLINGVTAVDFSYASGVSQSTGVLRIDMELTDGATGESIRLYREIHMRNTP